MNDDSRTPPRLRRVPGEKRRSGRHFEAIRAAFRRSRFLDLGGMAPPVREAKPGGDAIALQVVPSLSVDGIRALFHHLDSAKRQQSHALDESGASFVRAVELLARGGRSQGSDPSRDAAARARLDGALTESGEPIGVLWVSFAGGTDGLRARLALPETQLSLDVDAVLEIRFEGGPTLREPLRAGEARFPAGAALLEVKEVVSLAIHFPTFGRLRLDPPPVSGP